MAKRQEQLDDDGEPEPQQSRRGFVLTPLAEDIVERANIMKEMFGAPQALPVRPPPRVPEAPTVVLLRRQIAEERQRAQVAEERAARQDQLALASAQREARMAELAEIADARAAAGERRQAEADERERRREIREKHVYWATIASVGFAFIAAVAAIITISVTN